MKKIIKCKWQYINGNAIKIAKILNHKVHPEGLDVERIVFFKIGQLEEHANCGSIISIIKGKGKLSIPILGYVNLKLNKGTHIFKPFGIGMYFEMENGSELVRVSSNSPSQVRGEKLLIRDEEFIKACAFGDQALRWILTPQYLSRRIFLHHDKVLLSKSYNPVSWFHTTMFDVVGLPQNEEGEPAFKMSYNSRTEFNVCYAVSGIARVRMAQHPYARLNQKWNPWLALDDESTYHLNEQSGGEEEERIADLKDNKIQYLKNKHEVQISNGYVSLFCLFDPAPTGVERHQPGEYSDYEPLEKIIGTKTYKEHQKEMMKYDAMVDALTLAKVKGELDRHKNSLVWHFFTEGKRAMKAIEHELINRLIAEGKGREQILFNWISKQ